VVVVVGVVVVGLKLCPFGLLRINEELLERQIRGSV
jgi:hypothetical protein